MDSAIASAFLNLQFTPYTTQHVPYSVSIVSLLFVDFLHLNYIEVNSWLCCWFADFVPGVNTLDNVHSFVTAWWQWISGLTLLYQLYQSTFCHLGNSVWILLCGLQQLSVSEVSLRQACISVFCLTVFIEYFRKFSFLKVPAMLPHLSQFLNICYRLLIFVLLEMSIDILWLKCLSHLIFWSICTTSWPSSET